MPDQAETERWAEFVTLPFLSGILRKGEPRCCLHEDAVPDEIRDLGRGKLVRHGDHYTFCVDRSA